MWCKVFPMQFATPSVCSSVLMKIYDQSQNAQEWEINSCIDSPLLERNRPLLLHQQERMEHTIELSFN